MSPRNTMPSPRAESTPTLVLIDARPLQGPSARRGIGTYARGLLGGLVEEGFDSQVALLMDTRLPAPELPPGNWRLENSARRYHGRLAVYEDAVATGADLQRIRPAIYHSLGLTLPGRAPCPVALTLHDLIPWALGGRRLLGERFRFWPAKRLLPRADLVLAVSESAAADARRLGRVAAERIQVVPEGVDPAFAPRPDAPERVARRWGLQGPYLLYVGALDARKDPGGLLQAWRLAAQARSGLQLVLAGDPGPQAPSQMAGARRLGHVSSDELADLLAAALCLLFPSRYEGFGLPVLEAMACGCPVAAYRNSSLPELVGGAGLLVTDGDPLALGAAAAELATNPELARRLAAAGLERAALYTWRRSARLTVAHYEELLR